MAVATYNVTTSKTDLQLLWRRIQAGVVVAFQFGVEEWNLLQNLKNYDVAWSAREITFQLDLNDGVGAATIPEGGKEARPSSPTVVDATLTWILINKRFTISKTAQYIAAHTPKAMIIDQLTQQSKSAVRTIQRKVGDMFYGFSTGAQALVNASSPGTTLIIDSMYGVAGLGDASEARVVTDLFRVGDFVFLHTGATLRGSQPEEITAITPATPSITINALPASTADNDTVTFGNNLENATLAGGSEKDENLVGLLEMNTSASVHSVSSGTEARWDVGFSDTTGGRFTGVKLRKAKQGIDNNGGGKLDTVLWSNGVENDVVSQLQAGLRFSDAFNMEMDGMAKSKGVKFITTKRVPEGFVFMWDSKKSLKKGTLLPEPGKVDFSDGHKIQDDSGLVFSLDYPVFMCTQNRAAMAYVSNATVQ